VSVVFVAVAVSVIAVVSVGRGGIRRIDEPILIDEADFGGVMGGIIGGEPIFNLLPSLLNKFVGDVLLPLFPRFSPVHALQCIDTLLGIFAAYAGINEPVNKFCFLFFGRLIVDAFDGWRCFARKLAAPLDDGTPHLL